MDGGQGGSVLFGAAYATSSSSLLRSQPRPIHLAGLKPNYHPRRGVVQPAEMPISSGEWRWSDRSSNGFSTSPDVRLAAPAAPGGCGEHGGAPPALMPPRSLPCSVRPLFPKAICLSARGCWVMDTLCGGTWQDKQEKGPVRGGMGLGSSCAGVVPAAVQPWFATLGRDLDTEFEPGKCRSCPGGPLSWPGCTRCKAAQSPHPTLRRSHRQEDLAMQPAEL